MRDWYTDHKESESSGSGLSQLMSLLLSEFSNIRRKEFITPHAMLTRCLYVPPDYCTQTEWGKIKANTISFFKFYEINLFAQDT